MAQAVGCWLIIANVCVLPGSFHVRFVADRVTLRNVSLPAFRFFPLIIPPYSSSPTCCPLLDGQMGEAWKPSDKVTLVRISGEPWTERNNMNFVCQAPEGSVAGVCEWLGSSHSLLTPNSRVLLENLTGSQLVKKFPAFYGI